MGTAQLFQAGPARKRHFIEFSLRLSRACLGKMIAFIHKWLKKCRFLTFHPAIARRIPPGPSVRSRSGTPRAPAVPPPSPQCRPQQQEQQQPAWSDSAITLLQDKKDSGRWFYIRTWLPEPRPDSSISPLCVAAVNHSGRASSKHLQASPSAIKSLSACNQPARSKERTLLSTKYMKEPWKTPFNQTRLSSCGAVRCGAVRCAYHSIASLLRSR